MEIIEPSLHEFMSMTSSAIESGDPEALSYAVSRFAQYCFGNPPVAPAADELVEFLVSTFRSKGFQELTGSFTLLRILEFGWASFSESQRKGLLDALESSYSEYRDFMSMCVISKVLGEFYGDQAFEPLMRLSRVENEEPRSWVPMGLELLAKLTSDQTLRSRCIKRIMEMRNDDSPRVGTRALLSIEGLQGLDCLLSDKPGAPIKAADAFSLLKDSSMEILELTLEEFTSLCSRAIESGDPELLNYAVNHFAQYCFSNPPFAPAADELVEFLDATFRSKGFQELIGSYNLIRIVESDWASFSEDQRKVLLDALEASFAVYRDSMSWYVVSEILSECYADHALEPLMRMSRVENEGPRSMVPGALEYVAKGASDQTVRSRCMKRIVEMRNADSPRVRSEALVSIEALRARGII